MRPLATAAESSALDARIQEEWRVPGLLLMENAAARMWSSLVALAREEGAFPKSGDRRLAPPVVALAGPGKNGGDALAILRQARFAGHERLAAILATAQLGPLAAIQRDALVAMGIPVLVFGDSEAAAREWIGMAAVLVDGIAGTGLKGPLRQGSMALVQAARGAAAPVAAIDLPSGLRDDFHPDDPVLPATWTLAIEPRKRALYHPEARHLAGRVVGIEDVFPAESYSGLPSILLEESDLSVLAPRPEVEAHKGQRGRVAVLAGSPGMAGAAALACHGAFAAAAGLVTLYADAELFPSLSGAAGPAAFGPTIIRPLPPPPAFGDSHLESASDSYAIGCGWGQSAEKAALLARLLERGLPAVVDADGLRLLAPLVKAGFRATGPLLLTPHPGEFEALSGIQAAEVLARPAKILSEFSARVGAVVALKSHVTWIAAPDGRLAVLEGLEPSLGVAGSGDVLAGMAAALMASRAALVRGPGVAGLDVFGVAQTAVLAHAAAGRRARQECGWYEAGAIARHAARCLDPPRAFL